MKTTKRIVQACCILIVFCMVFAIPVSAAVNSTIRGKMTNFPYLYHGVEYASAVRALQRFLMCMPDYENRTTLENDGLDGGFGPNVEAAVRYFQVQNGIRLPNGTGEVASQTWGAIADNLFQYSADASHISLKNVSGDQIYYIDTSSTTYNFAYYNPEYKTNVYWLRK